MKKTLLLIITLLSLTACSFKKEIFIGEKETIFIEESEIEEEQYNQGKNSSVTKPLDELEVGLASKYNPKIKDYQIVDVRISDISLENNQDYLEKYNTLNDPIELKENFKIIVLKYETTLINYDTETFGSDGELYVEIQALDGNPIMYNDIKQYIDIYYLEKSEAKFKNETAFVKLIFQIPEESKEFLLKLGAADKVQAYFKVGS